MKLTNKYNLPEAIVNAVSAFSYPPKEGRYSVTDLVAPPQIRQLKVKHWEELEEDASARLWALMGQAIHYILEKGKPIDAIAEEKFEYPLDEVIISGKSDLLHNGELQDYKITSVYSFLLGDKPEWEKQLNLYAFLYRKMQVEIQSLTIHAILRDWKQSEAMKGGNYPPIAFQTVSVPLWPMEGQERYLKARLEAHRAENPSCSNEERWLRGEAWAVKKDGVKTARRVLDTEKEAQSYIEHSGEKGLLIEHRQGIFIRCENYCLVRGVCLQRKKNNPSA